MALQFLSALFPWKVFQTVTLLLYVPIKKFIITVTVIPELNNWVGNETGVFHNSKAPCDLCQLLMNCVSLLTDSKINISNLTLWKILLLYKSCYLKFVVFRNMSGKNIELKLYTFFTQIHNFWETYIIYLL